MNRSRVINPFEDDIVDKPRRIESSVTGLNDLNLEKLMALFERLERIPPPRLSARPIHARFLISPQPGYGKSHLIGRLFRALDRRATLVYLTPFEDPDNCWRSLLLKIVQELSWPDSVSISKPGSTKATQLESLAHGVLGRLTAFGLTNGSIPSKNRQKEAEILTRSPVEAFRKSDQNKKWMQHHLPVAARELGRFRSEGLSLKASPLSWVGVLYVCAYRTDDFELTECCLDWLKGGSLPPEAAQTVGLRPADLPPAEMFSPAANELCKGRLLDLCRLSGFYRPFVFCFDQTENYGKNKDLARALGTIIQDLWHEAANQMTVAALNQEVWQERIKPFWERAALDRLAPVVLEMEGLNRRQAQELAERRLLRTGRDRAWAGKWVDSGWLNDFFPAEGSEMGIRHFLRLCYKRWLRTQKQDEPIPELNLVLEKYKLSLAERPQLLAYDPNVFYWLIFEAAQGLSGLVIEKGKSRNGYFILRWTINDRLIFFGFEAGSDAMRWKAIAREAMHYGARKAETKVVFFRTLELQEVPRPSWKVIGPIIVQARSKYLDIIRLDREQVLELYAARSLYLDARSGDLEFTPEEILAFLRNRLAPFWTLILQDISRSRGPETDDSSSDQGPGPEAGSIKRKQKTDRRTHSGTAVKTRSQTGDRA